MSILDDFRSLISNNTVNPCNIQTAFTAIHGITFTKSEAEEASALFLKLCYVPIPHENDSCIYGKEEFDSQRDFSLNFVQSFLNWFRSVDFEVSGVSTFWMISIASLFYLQYSDCDFLWGSTEHFSVAQHLKKTILELSSFESLEQLFSINEASNVLFKVPECMIFLLKPLLDKNVWKRYPAAVNSARLLLYSTSGRKVGELTNLYMPIALLHLDDYWPSNKIIGLQLLSHLLQNITSTQLQWTGHCDVINEVLLKLLHYTELELLEALYPFLLQYLEKIKYKGPFRFSQEWTFTDSILEILERNLMCESQLALRRIHTKHLSAVLSLLGKSSCRHLVILIPIFRDYLIHRDSNNEETRLNIINSIETLIEICPERLSGYHSEVFGCLLRAVYELTPQDILVESVENLVLKFVAIDTKNSTHILEEILSQSDDLPLNFKSFCNKVLCKINSSKI